MRFPRLGRAAALVSAVSMMIYASAALARTPYRSNPPAATPATSQEAAVAASAGQGVPATCADGQCAKPAAGLADASAALATDHRYGTVLDWAESPGAAGKEAARDKKLVFLIQISGNFTRQEFT